MQAAGGNFVEIANFVGVVPEYPESVHNDLSLHVLTILGDFMRYIRLVLYETKGITNTTRCIALF